MVLIEALGCAVRRSCLLCYLDTMRWPVNASRVIIRTKRTYKLAQARPHDDYHLPSTKVNREIMENAWYRVKVADSEAADVSFFYRTGENKDLRKEKQDPLDHSPRNSASLFYG